MEFIVVSEQLTYILYSAIFGVFSSFLYFCIKILRMVVGVIPVKGPSRAFLNKIDCIKFRQLKGAKTLNELVFVHLIDVIYLIFVSVSFCIFAFYFNHGRIRWYLLLSAFLGFLAFYFSIGRLIIYISKYIVYIIKSFTKLIIYAIIKSVKIIFKPANTLLSAISLRVNHKLELKMLKKHILVKGESNGT